MPVATGHSYVVVWVRGTGVWEIDGPCINQVPHLFAVNINSDAGNGQLPVDIAICPRWSPVIFPTMFHQTKALPIKRDKGQIQ